MSDQPRHEHGQEEKGKTIPFFPDYVLDEVIGYYIALAILVGLASFIPAGLEEQANPLNTPAHTRPEWYFLFLYQSLKFVPEIVGVLLPIVAVPILLLVPWLDRSKSRAPRDRIVPIVIGIVSAIVIVALTIWGVLS